MVDYFRGCDYPCEHLVVVLVAFLRFVVKQERENIPRNICGRIDEDQILTRFLLFPIFLYFCRN